MSRTISRPPIQRLPVELLSDIFSAYLDLSLSTLRFLAPLPSWANPNPYHSQLHPEEPHTLGRVCRAWTQVAWTTPCLWRFLSLYTSHPRYSGDTLARLETYISRAGALPLSLTISDAPWYEYEDDIEHLGRFSAFIKRHAHRIQHLRLQLPEYLYRWLPHLECNFPMLESIYIRSVTEWTPTKITFDPRQVPRLTALGYQAVPFCTLDIQDTLPWTRHLTVLDLEYAPVDTIWSILNHTARTLVHCRLANVGQYMPDQPLQAQTYQWDPIDLHCLETLDISAKNGDGFGALRVLSFISAPLLVRLRYTSGEWARRPSAEALKAFLDRSGCCVPELVILVRHAPKLYLQTAENVRALSALDKGYKDVVPLKFALHFMSGDDRVTAGGRFPGSAGSLWRDWEWICRRCYAMDVRFEDDHLSNCFRHTEVVDVGYDMTSV